MFSAMLSTPKSKAVAAVGAAGATALGWWLFPRNQKRPEHILIVGGGTAGVGVAAMLHREGIHNVSIIEPRDVHYYQPLWTLVGGGIKPVEQSARPMKNIIPKNTNWIQKKVQGFTPENNQVELDDGSKVKYDFLVVASGMQIDWDKVQGLKEGLEKPDSGVVSIYDLNYADKTAKTFDRVKNLEAPKLLFTMSPTVIKCAGAPQKIMWLMDDTLRKLGKRDGAYISFWTPGGSMFGVPYYSEKLEKIRQERNVDGKFKHELIAVDANKKIATFENKENGQKVEEKFDLLHVAPHMSAPGFLKKSPISDAEGWVDVDKHTLQSKKFPNVFGIGDCTNTPNSKTAAAITSQAPVLVHNLQQVMNGQLLDGLYAGYASCPLIIARGRTILAEFGYGGTRMETFAHDTGKFPFNLFGTEGAMQQRFFYFLKEQLFPFVYWNMWPRGLWYGTNGPIKPRVTPEIQGAKDPALALETTKKN
jgi:sulfide:quinone oxidoreductase